jgi:dTDP-4-dehydrorhamnose reductase
MSILFTGAAGQLGKALAAELAAKSFVGLDRSLLDIAKLDDVRRRLRAERAKVVINAAAYTKVDQAESEPRAAYVGNALGPRNLAIATAELGIPLVQISTDYVFDGRGTRPYHEYDETNPRSVYGKSKLAGEEAVRSLQPRHYIVRTAWLYHEIGNNFPRTMLRLAERGEVRVVSDQYGSPTWCPHLAQAILRLIESGAFGTYHFAGSGATSWFELTKTLYRLLELDARVLPVSTADFPRPAERPRYSVLTTMQDPEIVLPPWEEGLAEFAAHVRSTGVKG